MVLQNQYGGHLQPVPLDCRLEQKESDIVQLNGADFYLWRYDIELAVGDWKEEKYVSQLFVCAQIIAKCFRSKSRRNRANIFYKRWN